MQKEALTPLVVFLFSCLLGFALGAVYDVFRILRIAIKTPKWGVFLEDCIFFFIVTATSFIFILFMNSGVIRIYILLGEILGFIVYHFSVGIIVIGIADFIIRIVKRIFIFIFKIISFPFKFIYRYLYQKNVKTFMLISLNIKKLLKNLKISLKKHKPLVYNNDITENRHDSINSKM